MTSKSFQRPPTARTASIEKESWPVARDTTPTRLAVVNIRLSQPTAAEKKFSAYFKWSASLQRYLAHVTCSKAQRSIAISGYAVIRYRTLRLQMMEEEWPWQI